MGIKTSNQIRDGFLIIGSVITLWTAISSFSFATQHHAARLEDVVQHTSFVFKDYDPNAPQFQSPMFRNMKRWWEKY